MIENLARLGRSSGIHIILATQTPSAKVLTTQATHNITNRFCFRTLDNAQAIAILGKATGDKQKAELIASAKSLTQGQYIFIN
jgi:DNA segregation ATPase FtsK/SpoIIIE-like protein